MIIYFDCFLKPVKIIYFENNICIVHYFAGIIMTVIFLVY